MNWKRIVGWCLVGWMPALVVAHLFYYGGPVMLVIVGTALLFVGTIALGAKLLSEADEEDRGRK
jgi:hypothetical protein